MGNTITNNQSRTKLTRKQIAKLIENTHYTEEEIGEWYSELLHYHKNGKLTKKEFDEAYAEFYHQGRSAKYGKSDASIEPVSLKLGDEFPNFHLKTTIGEIQLYDWMGNGWCVFFSHPADFTPVCTTELSRAAKLTEEFRRRNVKCIALSCDSIENHNDWIKDLQAYIRINQDDSEICQSEEFPFPIIEDTNRVLAKRLGMIDPDEFDSSGLPLTARAVFIIGSDKRLKASILYPASTGRNFDEILRLVDALQLSARLPVATPVDWKVGDKVMVPSSIKDEDIKKHLPKGIQIQGGLPSGKIYIRITEV